MQRCHGSRRWDDGTFEHIPVAVWGRRWLAFHVDIEEPGGLLCGFPLGCG